MGEVHRLVPSETVFGLQAAGRLLNKIFAPWVQDLALLVEGVEAVRPPGALPDWQPGAVVRLPFSKKNCCDGEVVCSQALMALADTAMVIACSAAWNGYRPMSTIDQTTHFLRPVNFDVIADARVVAHRSQYQLRARHAARSRRQTAGRHGGERVFNAVRDPRRRILPPTTGDVANKSSALSIPRGAFISPPESLNCRRWDAVGRGRRWSAVFCLSLHSR
jgi:hypothetical protein